MQNIIVNKKWIIDHKKWIISNKKWVIAGIILLLASTASTIFVSRRVIRVDPSKARFAKVAIPVKAVSAKVETLTEIIGASGKVAPLSFTTLQAGVSTRIEVVSVDVGDLVSSGQVLLQFNRSLPMRALKSAQDRVSKARADLEKTERKNRSDHERLKAALAVSQDLALKTKTDLENSQRFLESMETLYQKGLIAKASREKAQLQFDTAKANDTASRHKIIQSVNDLFDFPVNSKSLLATAQSNYSIASEQLAQASQDLNDTVVEAPFDGVVTERPVNLWETPKVKDALITLGRLDTVVIVSEVAEEKASSVHLGESASIVFNSFPNRVWKGVIHKIDPRVDSKTQILPVHIAIDNPELELKPGMTGFARIERTRLSLAVPSVAVIKPVKDKATLFVVGPDSAIHLRSVKTGIIAESMTEVISGISEGEMVVTAGQKSLRDKDKVRVEVK